MNLFRSILIGLVLAWLTCSAGATDSKTSDLYKAKCQSCHGADGKATNIGKKLGAKDFQDPEVSKMSEAEMISVTTTGKNKMPAYKGKITDAQIAELVKYIKEMK